MNSNDDLSNKKNRLTGRLVDIPDRNYIVSLSNGIEDYKNKKIDHEVCEYFAKKRVDNGKNWENSPVSKQPACKKCYGKGVVKLDHPQKRFVYENACGCVVKKLEKLDKISTDDIVMGDSVK
jgi:hypothetical protein